jgi:hypothetical protein
MHHRFSQKHQNIGGRSPQISHDDGRGRTGLHLPRSRTRAGYSNLDHFRLTVQAGRKDEERELEKYWEPSY